MQHDQALAETGDDDAAAPAIDTASLPITLRFEAGTLSLPLARFSSLAPGYVFELDKPLDGRVIRIFANDVPVGEGELVAVGDLVGVRIRRLFARPAPIAQDD